MRNSTWSLESSAIAAELKRFAAQRNRYQAPISLFPFELVSLEPSQMGDQGCFPQGPK